MAEAVKLRPRITPEALNEAVIARARPQTSQQQQDVPEGNAFYRILIRPLTKKPLELRPWTSLQ